MKHWITEVGLRWHLPIGYDIISDKEKAPRIPAGHFQQGGYKGETHEHRE